MVQVKPQIRKSSGLLPASLRVQYFFMVGAILVASIFLIARSHQTVHGAEFVHVDQGNPLNMNSVQTSKVSAFATTTNKPYILYGTAWKKEQTSELVKEAILSGFRYIDTACQPKHYNEAGVGDGWVSASKSLGLKREDLFLQTKFTSLSGQDKNRLPYDPNVSLEKQVSQSVQKSLENLQTSYLDRVVLHSPMPTFTATMAVWRVLESYVEDGTIHHLGVSNCYDYDFFVRLYNEAKVKPTALQNRFYSNSGFDIDLRTFCAEHDIKYQSFWTLTANRKALASAEVQLLAVSKRLTSSTLMYAYMMTLGHTPLSGTTNKSHMEEDVEVMKRIQSGEDILSPLEMQEMDKILGVGID